MFVETSSVNILPTRSVVLGWMFVCCRWRAKRFYLCSTDALAKACVRRAALKKKKKKPQTVNWPGYGLLQLNLKH